MGWFLLDGRSKLTFHDAFLCFEALQFGAMAEECKLYMLQLVRDGDGFIHGSTYVNKVAEDLAAKLIVEEEEDYEEHSY